MTKILLKQSDYEKILNHARSEFPNEACGLIAGRDEETASGWKRTIEKVYLLSNVDQSNSHFSMDPSEQFRVLKDMCASGIKPLGNWHSHPQTPARPSGEDIRLAFDSEASYLILSLQDAEQPILCSYHIEGDTVETEELTVLSEQSQLPWHTDRCER